MLSDTSPEIDKLQIERLRRATPAERLQTALKQSQLVIYMARQAIQRVHPSWSDQQVNTEYVRIHYGEKLASLWHNSDKDAT